MEEGFGQTGLITVMAVFGLKQIAFNMNPVIGLLKRPFKLIRVGEKTTVIESQNVLFVGLLLGKKKG